MAKPKITVTLRIDPDLHEQILAYAKAESISFNAASSLLLSAGLQALPIQIKHGGGRIEVV